MKNLVSICDNKYVLLSKDGIDELISEFGKDSRYHFNKEISELTFPLFVSVRAEWCGGNDEDDIFIREFKVADELEYHWECIKQLRKYKGWQL